MTSVRISVVSIALSISFRAVSTSWERLSAQDRKASGALRGKHGQSLGDGWRLPTDDEWRRLAKHYGGISADSDDKGKVAYKALLAGDSSGFGALLGGGRSDDGQYARLEAHGVYWTASESDPARGWFYNFAQGGQALHRQNGGEKQRSFSVRCVRN